MLVSKVLSHFDGGCVGFPIHADRNNSLLDLLRYCSICFKNALKIYVFLPAELLHTPERNEHAVFAMLPFTVFIGSFIKFSYISPVKGSNQGAQRIPVLPVEFVGVTIRDCYQYKPSNTFPLLLKQDWIQDSGRSKCRWDFPRML